MSLFKAIKFIEENDMKGLGDMFDPDNYENMTDNKIYYYVHTILDLAIYSRNATAVSIIVEWLNWDGCITPSGVGSAIADNEFWESMPLLKKQIDISDVLLYKNEQLLVKCLECGVFTLSDVTNYIETRDDSDVNIFIYKYLSTKINNLSELINIPTLIIYNLGSRDMETYKETLPLLDIDAVIDEVDIMREICNKLTVPKYHELVKYVSNEKIINQLTNPGQRYFNFDPALIDLIGIRVRLQSVIDTFEQKILNDDHFMVSFHINIIRFSGLNFHKELLIQNIRSTDCFITMIQSLPQNYFTQEDKSKFLIKLLRFVNTKTIHELFKLGWKIYDTEANRNAVNAYNVANFRDHEIVKLIYSDIPKY